MAKRDKVSTRQFNVRIPPVTQEQLSMLKDETGMTTTQMIIVAVDRLATERINSAKKGKGKS